MQKKAIRNITKSQYTAHTAPLFTELKILPLNHLITYTKGLYGQNEAKNLIKRFCKFFFAKSELNKV